MINHVLVLGGGSAGFLAAISLKVRLPQLRITVLRSKELGIIGVGEGTTYSFPIYLHGRLGIDPAAYHRIAQPTWKLGIRFYRWGPREHFDYTFRAQVTSRWESLPKLNGYYCDEDFDHADVAPALMSHNKAFLRDSQGRPIFSTDVGYHIENRLFVDFLEGFARHLGIVIDDDTVLDVRQNDLGIASLQLQSGRTFSAELYIDSSGFFSLLLGKALQEPFVSFRSSLFCDRAVVGGWDRTTEPIKPYTAAEGMEAGWCWQIEHEHRINRGYVYCSSFISDEQAEAEFRARNPKVTSTRIVKFTSGCYERAWVKNVVAIGNACGFVEPLEATALGVICEQSDVLANCLVECDRQPGAALRRQYNKRIAAKWENIRQFLAVHYKFNTCFETPFWRECREKTELRNAEPIVEYFEENGPGNACQTTLLDRFDPFGLEGYWSLLIGQKVPYRKTHTPTQQERETWRRIQQAFKNKALNGISIPEALALVRRPDFRWPPLYASQRSQVMKL